MVWTSKVEIDVIMIPPVTMEFMADAVAINSWIQRLNESFKFIETDVSDLAVSEEGIFSVKVEISRHFNSDGDNIAPVTATTTNL